jgi:hypothetical protein
MPRPKEDTHPPMQAELRSLFRKLRTPLTRFLYLADQSFVDHAGLLGEEAENGPDAKLIKECARLFCIQIAINTLSEEIADGAAKDVLTKPIHDQWYKARKRLLKLDGPKTLEGAKGAAMILMHQYPEGLSNVAAELDQRSWLAIQCAQFILTRLRRCPLMTVRTIEDINDQVLAHFNAVEHEDSGESGWKPGEPPNDGSAYETRIAPAGARWHRPMPIR